ncbi:MAG TPA: glycosyltransferase family 4 protein [Candidatus Angelobacter sp.]|nr:glycosyltransferase family 4 protein [Candidatus Angelobacter sp.]
MKILYISQYFPPEIGAPAARVSELSSAWARQGNDVTVLTGFPNHPTGRVPAEYRTRLRRLLMREDRGGVMVQRTWLLPLPNRKSWERMLNYGSFCLSASLRGLFLPRHDVVIATSPQLLVGLSGLIVAKLKRAPFVFEVRDLWPESLEAVGVSGKNSFLVRVLGRIAGLLYRRSDHIVVVTNAFREHLHRHWNVPKEKISVVVNGVDDKLFQPQAADPAVLAEFGVQGRFVVGYIGTIGNAHSVETLVETARLLQNSDPEIVIVVVGEGADKQKLEQLVREHRLQNIRIFPGQPRERIPAIVAASHVCLVLLKKSDLFKTVIPTKMLEFMSCGRPLVAGLEGESAELIRKADAGICVMPEDAAALAGAIRTLRSDPQLACRFGNHARNFITQNLSRQSTAIQYRILLNSFCGARERGTSTAQQPAAQSSDKQGSAQQDITKFAVKED